MKHLRANYFSFSLLIKSLRGHILRYSSQFKLNSKSIQNHEVLSVCYEGWWAVPALLILAGPEHEHQQGQPGTKGGDTHKYLDFFLQPLLKFSST